MKEDTGWRKNKYGGLFNIFKKKEKQDTNKYMNERIREKVIASKIIENNYDYDEGEQDFIEKNTNIIYDNCVKTDEQVQAIYEWTRDDTGYGSADYINEHLKEEHGLYYEIARQKADIVESCINQTLNSDTIVFHGGDYEANQLFKDNEIEIKGLLATSLSKSLASNFAVKKNGITMKLHARSGLEALYIGEKTSFTDHTGKIKNEQELLFKSGHKIRIIYAEKLYDKSGNFMNWDVEGDII